MATEEMLAADPALEAAAADKGRAGRPRWRRVRPWFVRLHRWVGLTLGAWIILQSVSGLILVFQDQINAWLHPGWYAVTPGDLGPQAAVDAARPLRPDWHVHGVALPVGNDDVYGVGLEDAEAERYLQVFVDPGSAKVLGTDDYESGFVRVVYRLHDGELVRSIGGVLTTTVLGWLGVAWLVLLLLGILPGMTQRVRRWRQLLAVRRGQGGFRFTYDLHRTLGLLLFVPLFLVVLTGIPFVFPEQAEAVWETLTPAGDEHIWEPPAEDRLASTDTGGAPLDMDTLLRLVTARHPDGVVHYLGAPPPERTGLIEAYVSKGYDPWATQRGYGGNVAVHMDAYTGEQLRVADPRDFSVWTRLYDEWAFPLHAGSFGRSPSRVVWLLLAAGATASGVTAYRMWFSRRRARADRRRVERTGPPAPAG